MGISTKGEKSVPVLGGGCCHKSQECSRALPAEGGRKKPNIYPFHHYLAVEEQPKNFFRKEEFTHNHRQAIRRQSDIGRFQYSRTGGFAQGVADEEWEKGSVKKTLQTVNVGRHSGK